MALIIKKARITLEASVEFSIVLRVLQVARLEHQCAKCTASTSDRRIPLCTSPNRDMYARMHDRYMAK